MISRGSFRQRGKATSLIDTHREAFALEKPLLHSDSDFSQLNAANHDLIRAIEYWRKQLGWFGLSASGRQARLILVNVAGYPADKPEGTMWFNSGRIVDSDKAFLRYLMDTEGGESVA